MPGEDMVAEHRARAFEEAIDEAIDALKRQIEKFKGEGEIAARRHACDGRNLRRGFLPFAISRIRTGGFRSDTFII